MTATTSPTTEPPTAPSTGSLKRPRAAWGDADVPIVLRLPDIHAPLASQLPAANTAVETNLETAPDPTRSAQSLPLWLFVLAACLGVVAGLIVLNRWKAYRAASGPQLGPSAVHQPVPTWKVPLQEKLSEKESENSPRVGGASMADTLPKEQAETAAAAAAADSRSGEESSAAVTQASATVPQPNPLKDEPGKDESPRPRNPHFGPPPPSATPKSVGPAETKPGEIGQNHIASRPDVAANVPQQPPSATPGVAELEGVIVKPSPRPLYDRARQGIY